MRVTTTDSRQGAAALVPRPDIAAADAPSGGGDADRTDGELWEFAKGGDEAAFAQLFDRHAEAVWTTRIG